MSDRAAALSGFIHRRSGGIVVVAVLLAIVGCIAASSLRIDQELRRLLPDHFTSVTRLEEMSQRLGQRSELYVTIRSPSREANIAFGERVADWAREQPSVRAVTFRRDLTFFDDRALLYASLRDLLDLRRRVIGRIRDEVGRQAFGRFASDPVDGEAQARADEPEASSLGVDIDEVRAKYAVPAGMGEYMEADGGRLMVVKLLPERPSTDLGFAQALIADVERQVAALEPTTYHPELDVELSGSYVQHTGRAKALGEQVVRGSAVAIVALLGTLVLYFRGARAVLLIFVPLLGSVVGALAFARIAFGSLNLVSAFIFAVLLGLGVDFGIHVLSRYREELARGADSTSALTITLATTGWTTVAGGVSTALAFAALMIADFQGFAQFGQVAAVGVVLALVGAVIVVPALTLVLERWRPWPVGPRPSRRTGPTRFRGRTVWWVAAALGIACVVPIVPELGRLEFEHDLRQLGPRREPGPAGPPAANYRDAVGKGQTVDPVVALTQSAPQARSLQAQMDAIGAMTPGEVEAFDPRHPPTRPMPEAAPSDPEVGDDLDDDIEEFGDDDLEDPRFVALETLAVQQAVMSPEVAETLGRYGTSRLSVIKDRLRDAWSIHAFVPRLQPEKLEVIADIRRRIDDKRGALSDDSRDQLDRWERYLHVDRPIDVGDLPRWVEGEFASRPGELERFVVIATGGSKADVDNARRIYAAFGSLPTAAGEVPTAAEFYVIPEIFGAIEHDGPRVMVLAIGVMLATAVILLRRVGAALAVAVTLGLSLVWLAGVWLELGWKLNFFNIIVVPLLIGMGQDDALHIAQRHHEEGGAIGPALRGAGGAVAATTVTTVWGFVGMLFADHRGLNSMAWAAVAGMLLALLASLVVLPALLDLTYRGRKLPRERREFTAPKR